MNNVLFECVNCQRHEIIPNGKDGNACRCGGYLNPLTTTSLPLTLNHRDKPQPTKGDVSIDHSVLCGRDQLKKWASQQKERADKTPLLTIELQDESSVPKVYYKGEEVKFKKNIQFEWDTSDATDPPGLTYAIENYELKNGTRTLNRIERRKGFHM